MTSREPSRVRWRSNRRRRARCRETSPKRHEGGGGAEHSRVALAAESTSHGAANSQKAAKSLAQMSTELRELVGTVQTGERVAEASRRIEKVRTQLHRARRSHRRTGLAGGQLISCIEAVDSDCLEHRFQILPEVINCRDLHPLIGAVRIDDGRAERNQLHPGILLTDHAAFEASVHRDEISWLAEYLVVNFLELGNELIVGFGF